MLYSFDHFNLFVTFVHYLRNNKVAWNNCSSNYHDKPLPNLISLITFKTYASIIEQIKHVV